MTNWPGGQSSTPHEPGWGDPNAPTRAVPRFQRPQTAPGNGPGMPPAPPPAQQPWPPAPAPAGQYPGHPPQRGSAPSETGWAPSHSPLDSGAGTTAGPGRNRNRFLLALAVVVVVVGGAVAYTRVAGLQTGVGTVGGSESSTTAQGSSTVADTVTGYLEALRDGDAQKVLSYSKSQPADTTLLTDEVLAKQLATWPISDIQIDEIDGDEKTAARLFAKVSVKFGDKVHTGEIELSRNLNGGWWIEHAANEFKPSGQSEDYKTLSVYGKKLTFGESFFVFPGYVEVESSNPYIDAVGRDVAVLPGFRVLLPAFQAEFALNGAGDQAVKAAVDDAYVRCEQSNQIAPPGCPARLEAGNAVDGTVTWGKAVIGDLELFLHHDLTADAIGLVRIPVTYQSADGQMIESSQVWVNQEKFDIRSTPPQMVE